MPPLPNSKNPQYLQIAQDPYGPLRADIFPGNIRANFDLLRVRAAGARPHAQSRNENPPKGLLPLPEGDRPFNWPLLMPVLKADAYGHGHIATGLELLRGGAEFFASGDVAESVALRLGLTAEGKDAPYVPILSLLGLCAADDAAACVKHGIIPLIYSARQIEMLAALLPSLPGEIGLAIKCNSGMSRLGFDEEDLPELREALRKIPGARPLLALSHLHSADTAAGREQTRAQAGRFAAMLASLRQDWPHLAASLGNSAGTLLAPEISAQLGPHVCRPGLALYGYNPFAGTDLESLGRGLKAAMAVSAPLISERILSPGQGLGYGHTFKAGRPMRIGIMAAGYADGFSRGLSNKGFVCVEGERAAILGRVSMQMSAVDLSALPQNAKGPFRVWILGGPHARAVSGEELAGVWGSIVYELLCLLGRARRVYHT
ncbi:MAG: alanine racemase [Desulfovibrio sp.]|jgi:alanine racemase|nr:alanine racemase [Desulfovibrio sp.]